MGIQYCPYHWIKSLPLNLFTAPPLAFTAPVFTSIGAFVFRLSCRGQMKSSWSTGAVVKDTQWIYISWIKGEAEERFPLWAGFYCQCEHVSQHKLRLLKLCSRVLWGRDTASAASCFPGSAKDEGSRIWCSSGRNCWAQVRWVAGSETWCVTLLLWNVGKHPPIWF